MMATSSLSGREQVVSFHFQRISRMHGLILCIVQIVLTLHAVVGHRAVEC